MEIDGVIGHSSLNEFRPSMHGRQQSEAEQRAAAFSASPLLARYEDVIHTIFSDLYLIPQVSRRPLHAIYS